MPTGIFSLTMVLGSLKLSSSSLRHRKEIDFLSCGHCLNYFLISWLLSNVTFEEPMRFEICICYFWLLILLIFCQVVAEDLGVVKKVNSLLIWLQEICSIIQLDRFWILFFSFEFAWSTAKIVLVFFKLCQCYLFNCHFRFLFCGFIQ